MGDSNPALRLKTPYRFDQDRLFFVWVYFLILSLLAQAIKFAPPSFLLLPLSLLIVRLNAYRFLVLLLAGYTFFFQPGVKGIVSRGFFVADALTLTFVGLALLSLLTNPPSWKLPRTFSLLTLYAFVAYVLVLTPLAVLKNPLSYVLYDVKNVLYLALVPLLLLLDGNSREPKKFFLLLGTFVGFCTLHSIEVIIRYLITPERIQTSNEIFISDAVIIAALMLRFTLAPRTVWMLRASLALSILALLLTQTRGLWLSTVMALGSFYILEIIKPKNFRPLVLLRRALAGLLLVVAGNYALGLVMGETVVGFIRNRFQQESLTQLIDPYSSTGYRLHEMVAVWMDRSIFGHGPGGTLRIFFTQLGKSEYLDWWAIHSGYFEFLHKYGFVGLILAMTLFITYYFLGRRLANSPSRAVSVFGAIIATVVMNHLIVSITSGWLLRHGVLLWIPLFLIAERLRPRTQESPSAKALGSSEVHRSKHLSDQGVP